MRHLAVHHQLSFSQNLYQIVCSLQELAVLEMQQLRQSVAEARPMVELSAHLAARLPMPKDPSTAIVLLTHQSPFVDQSSREAVESALTLSKEYKAPLFVFGQVGAKILNQLHPDIQATIISESPDTASIQHDLLRSHAQILVVYSQYKNLLTQSPTTSQIGHTDQTKLVTGYLLIEPDREEVSRYLDQVILPNLFRLYRREAHLAFAGSRLTALEKSRQIADKKIIRLKRLASTATRKLKHKQQLERLSSRRLWKGRAA